MRKEVAFLRAAGGDAGERSSSVPRMRVSAMPVLKLGNLKKGCGSPPFPIGGEGVSYWYNARAAIWQGLAALGIKPGDRIIAPAYSCGSEIDVLFKAGVQLDFYRIDKDLNADLQHIESLCEKPAVALFITHYYGLAQPVTALRDLAKRHNLYLIEDVSHGLYSCTRDGQPLGSSADMAVYSLWKTLPIPDGGVLSLAHAHSQLLPTPVSPRLMSIAGRGRVMVEDVLSESWPRFSVFLRRRISDPLIHWLRRRAMPHREMLATPAVDDAASCEQLPESADVAFQADRKQWGMSGLSRMLMRYTHVENMVGLRRARFHRLANGIGEIPGVSVLINRSLPEGCCPLFFPLVVEEPKAFARHLAAHGVGFFRGWCVFHPSVPWALFPLESHLKENVIVLPIHQTLSDESIEFMIDVVHRWDAGV